ncbi:MAG: TPM domain-containing protein [Clostridia bacterium]|nr:TPM domain-containing protein [Clostridia bacterium]
MKIKPLGFTIFVVILLVVFVGGALFGGSSDPQTLPTVTDRFFVNDFADVLTVEDEQAVYEQGVALQETTTAQVVLVTVQDTGDSDLETFSYDLATQWGIGQAEEDNGILLLFTVDGPHSRIEVGYGLEGALNDSKAGRILDTYLVPAYGDSAAWSAALRDTYTAILNEVYGEYGMADLQTPLETPLPVEEELTTEDLAALLPFLILFVLIILLGRRGGGSGLGWLLLANHHGGGFRGGGGFGGGGGGFRGGGGGFGGGGASR